MVFDLLAATLLTLLGAGFGAFAFRAWRIVRRIRREKTDPGADLPSWPFVRVALVALLLWMLAAAAIAIPLWIDAHAGL
jgi:hypothetical protein